MGGHRPRGEAAVGGRSLTSPDLPDGPAGAGPSAFADLPVARVVVDTPLAHLDRPFDYAVPDALRAVAVPGTRIRVRFAGRTVGGFVLERLATSEHGGALAPLQSVVSPEPVLSPEIAALARAVADRYAGTLADVLRLALPKRHARTEAEPATGPAAAPPERPSPGTWTRYPAGTGFIDALASGGAPRAIWRALPGDTWPVEIAVAVQACLAAGRGAVVVVPDARDLARLDAALRECLGEHRHVVLTADLGPARRYRRYLAVRRGAVRCAVGTRSAMWAPVPDLGLVAVWDDGDDLHKEQRAPYPHVREVLALRAHRAGAGALVGGFAPSVEAEQLVERGWAHAVTAARDVVRRTAPRVVVAGADTELERDPDAARARLPSSAWRTARDALQAGLPVLVQVPRAGYQPSLACASCREPARCTTCAGPLGRTGGTAAPPSCRWCGRPHADWSCARCAARVLRASSTGSRRTAEELGRAFPGTVVRTSDRDGVLTTIGAGPALVVATPGAEPVADGGYGAVLLLDAWALLARPDLRTTEEAFRRWCGAAALARPGVVVVVMADPALPAVQALVRWDPATFAAREYAERAELRFPPAVRMAALDGSPAALVDLLDVAQLPASADVLGPVTHQDGERALVRVPWPDGAELARALHAAQAVRSARKSPETVRVELDPLVLL